MPLRHCFPLLSEWTQGKLFIFGGQDNDKLNNDMFVHASHTAAAVQHDQRSRYALISYLQAQCQCECGAGGG